MPSSRAKLQRGSSPRSNKLSPLQPRSYSGTTPPDEAAEKRLLARESAGQSNWHGAKGVADSGATQGVFTIQDGLKGADDTPAVVKNARETAKLQESLDNQGGKPQKRSGSGVFRSGSGPRALGLKALYGGKD